MADPISGVNRGASIGPTSAAPTGTAAAATRADTVTAGTPNDSADVSKTEGLLEVMAQAGAEASAVDETRVSALRDAIASGRFQADAQQVAQKMIEWEGELSGRNAS